MAAKSTYDQNALHMAALVVLLERMGGAFGYTEAEYQGVLARHGGKTMMAVHVEVLKAPDAESPDEVRLTLVRKPPGNAELPS